MDKNNATYETLLMARSKTAEAGKAHHEAMNMEAKIERELREQFDDENMDDSVKHMFHGPKHKQ